MNLALSCFFFTFSLVGGPLTSKKKKKKKKKTAKGMERKPNASTEAAMLDCTTAIWQYGLPKSRNGHYSIKTESVEKQG